MGNEREARVYDVEQYRREGDAPDDDTAMIERAVNAARVEGGGVIAFQPRIYQFSRDIELDDDVKLP
jgi:hypothetical protein